MKEHIEQLDKEVAELEANNSKIVYSLMAQKKALRIKFGE
jgi:hypothetical protein